MGWNNNSSFQQEQNRETFHINLACPQRMGILCDCTTTAARGDKSRERCCIPKISRRTHDDCVQRVLAGADHTFVKELMCRKTCAKPDHSKHSCAKPVIKPMLLQVLWEDKNTLPWITEQAMSWANQIPRVHCTHR